MKFLRSLPGQSIGSTIENNTSIQDVNTSNNVDASTNNYAQLESGFLAFEENLLIDGFSVCEITSIKQAIINDWSFSRENYYQPAA